MEGYLDERLKSASDSLASKTEEWLKDNGVQGPNIQISQSVCTFNWGGKTIAFIVSTTAFITYDTSQVGPED